MRFKAYECDFGIVVDGISYDFEHVNSLNVQNSERTRLTRGANANNKLGIIYKEGSKEPKVWDVVIMQMSIEIKALLDRVYENKSRVDVYCISRADGSKKMAKNAVLSTQPEQLVIDETPESMNIALSFETFDAGETYKEA